MREFRCEACEKMRPDDKISVVKRDMCRRLGVDPGMSERLVNYCNDNPDCETAATRIADEAAEPR